MLGDLAEQPQLYQAIKAELSGAADDKEPLGPKAQSLFAAVQLSLPPNSTSLDLQGCRDFNAATPQTSAFHRMYQLPDPKLIATNRSTAILKALESA